MGRFVVLEGLDGAGTTTQAALLVAHLGATGRRAIQTAEPTAGPIGRAIRDVLRSDPAAADRSALPWMFAADRRDHLARTVEPALDRGDWVVSDRYFHSSLAYQSLDWPLDDVARLNDRFRVPDLTVFIDVDVDVALGRIARRGGAVEWYEADDRLRRVAKAYRSVLRWVGDRGDTVVVVSGELPVAEVSAAVFAAVDALT